MMVSRMKVGFMFAIFWLSGCNGTDNAQVIEPDWINNPSQSTSSNPVPTPTVTPTAAPTSSAADLYSGSVELASYVEKFVDDAKIQGVNVLPDMSNPKLEIQVASLSSYGSGVIGLCETGGGSRRVTFDPGFWNPGSETQRELLVHHELGHCVLYRAHKTDLLPSGAYASIMYPVIMSSSTYLNNYDYYQQELFVQAGQSDANTKKTYICNVQDLGQ